MRLDPVFLVEPKPKPPSIPTRRAFLLAGGMFAAGATLGGACGFAAGVVSGGEPTAPNDGGGDELAPTGDSLLDELRRLAVKAPIEELVEKRLDFVNLLYTTYPNDEIAWRGVGRLARHYLEHDQAPDRRVFARWIAQVIERSPAEIRRPYEEFITPLRRTK